MDDIVIVGAGGFGRELAWLIECINKQQKKYVIKGFIDDFQPIGSVIYSNYKVIDTIDSLISYRKKIKVVIAFGSTQKRLDIYNKIHTNHNISFPNIIAPEVSVNEDALGIGNIICKGNILTVDYKIGNFNLINLSCTIGHDVVLQNFITINPGSNISGNVLIKNNVEIGTGSKIIQGIEINENAIIGAGSVVVRNIPSHTLSVGVPAKPIKHLLNESR